MLDQSLRWGYLGLGFIFLGLGGVGVVTPGLPTTIFCILALWAFKRSSPKMEAWLLNHRVFGPTLRDWEKDHSIKFRTKVIAITMLWVMICISLCFVRPVVQGILLVTAVAVSLFIWTRKTTPIVPATDSAPVS